MWRLTYRIVIIIWSRIMWEIGNRKSVVLVQQQFEQKACLGVFRILLFSLRFSSPLRIPHLICVCDNRSESCWWCLLAEVEIWIREDFVLSGVCRCLFAEAESAGETKIRLLPWPWTEQQEQDRGNLFSSKEELDIHPSPSTRARSELRPRPPPLGPTNKSSPWSSVGRSSRSSLTLTGRETEISPSQNLIIFPTTSTHFHLPASSSAH
jgi:hypothetical protein